MPAKHDKKKTRKQSNTTVKKKSEQNQLQWIANPSNIKQGGMADPSSLPTKNG
jgi:hypothetical protein